MPFTGIFICSLEQLGWDVTCVSSLWCLLINLLIYIETERAHSLNEILDQEWALHYFHSTSESEKALQNITTSEKWPDWLQDPSGGGADTPCSSVSEWQLYLDEQLGSVFFKKIQGSIFNLGVLWTLWVEVKADFLPFFSAVFFNHKTALYSNKLHL